MAALQYLRPHYNAQKIGVLYERVDLEYTGAVRLDAFARVADALNMRVHREKLASMTQRANHSKVVTAMRGVLAVANLFFILGTCGVERDGHYFYTHRFWIMAGMITAVHCADVCLRILTEGGFRGFFQTAEGLDEDEARALQPKLRPSSWRTLRRKVLGDGSSFRASINENHFISYNIRDRRLDQDQLFRRMVNMEVVDARVVWETMANLMDAGVLVTVQSEEIFANNRFEVLAEAYGGAGPVVAVMEAARRGAPVGAGAPEAATELLHVMVCDAKWEPDNVVVYMLIEVSPNQAKGEEVTSLETLDILRRKPTDKPAFADPPVRP
eukprot:gene2610-3367_t